MPTHPDARLQQRILKEIQTIVFEAFEVETPLEPAMSLKRDLKLDSLSTIVIATELEARFRIKLNEEGDALVTTVGDLMALVERRVLAHRVSE